MSFLGVDIGTTGCKAVAFDEGGSELSAAYRDYPVSRPKEGWAELNPDEVMSRCLEVIAEASGGAGNDPVTAIGISSQGEAVIPLAANKEVLFPAQVSFDIRAARIADEWSAAFGRRKLYDLTGHTPHPMFSLFKLLWLRHNRPDVWRRAAAFHCFEDLLQLRLGVEPAMSWPMAGRTMLFNVREHTWDSTICDAAGIDPARLPRVLPSGSIAGVIPDDRCRELGVEPGTPVVTGGHDQPCAALGAGALNIGEAMYATGTVECICPVIGSARFSGDMFRGNLCTYDYTLPELYTTVAFSLTGGNILQWFRSEFGTPEEEQAKESGVSAYQLLLDRMPDEPSSLMVLPYFTPTGTPYFDPHASGAILGLKLDSSREEVLRALLEGVAFEMRLNLAILQRSSIDITRLVATGGGARSRKWTQLKADVLGTPVAAVKIGECGCLGVAMLARAAKSGTPITEVANDMRPEFNLVEPVQEHSDFYRDRFATYEKLYPAMCKLGFAGKETSS